MEATVFPPIHGDFGRQPQERCWKPTRIDLEEMKLKIAKIAKSRRAANQVEAVAKRFQSHDIFLSSERNQL